ncbi:antibiotic biosynthesis monooxygenase family protein [Ensifer aridi]|uniref:antibiotic biosynthesis monooxygenase family protein n=1 Tax=Ensifer aridi TaxID=1708715 RepID=UPI000A117710|nr:antibiotic biosynthesis monooxygenase family protein [Ensifer aridi]
MIIEIAELTVAEGKEAELEAGVAQAAKLFLRARGCHGLALHRVIETPDVYRLVVKWETVEDHMIHFRNSDDFQEWRRLVGHCFAKPPSVTHCGQVLSFAAD